MDVDKRFVTLGGECFEAEFEREQTALPNRLGAYYIFRLRDLLSERGERSVSLFISDHIKMLNPNYAARVELVRINVIRRAFDSGKLSFDEPYDEHLYKPLDMEESDFHQQPLVSDEEIRQFIICRAYWLSYRHPTQPGRYSVNFETPDDLDYLGATQADIRRNVLRLHNQGMLEFGKPTERLIVGYESTMPDRPKTPLPKPADWPPDKTHAALKKQLAALDTFRGRRYREVEHVEQGWKNLTLNILWHGFGQNSNNVDQFHQAKLAGRNHANMSEGEIQQNFEKRIEAFSAMLKSSLDELELMGAAAESKKSTSIETESRDALNDMPVKQPATHRGLLVFISHSSKDADLALALIDLLKTGLGLQANQIRCIRVDGYRLPVGVNTEDKLREEVNAAIVVVGLITPSSLDSYYVMFELGARWGANLFLAPLLAGVKASELSGPLGLLNALSASSDAQLHQLIEDISKRLALPLQPVASYVRHVSAVKALVDNIPTPAVTQPSAPVKQKLRVTLSTEGTPPSQVLKLVANRHVEVSRLDYMLSSEATIAGDELSLQGETIEIPINDASVSKVWNTPRPDQNSFDHSGPAKIRVTISDEGQARQYILPVQMEVLWQSSTMYRRLVGSQTFYESQHK